MTHKLWNLVIAFDEEAKKYTVGVNGVEMPDLPEAPKTAAHLPEFCKSKQECKYTETIR